MEFKFIIVTPQKRDKDINKIIEYIELKNDNFIVAKKFITNEYYKDTENNAHLYYLENSTISKSLKNNSILYISSDEENIIGMTMDEFYNSNILGMSLADFNNISSNFLNSNKDNFIIVWLDTKYRLDNNTLNKDINEVNYLFNKINELIPKYKYILCQLSLDEDTVDRTSENQLEILRQNLNFEHWGFGHYHTDVHLDDTYFCLFNTFEEI